MTDAFSDAPAQLAVDVDDLAEHLARWEPTGDLEGDVSVLNAVKRLARACRAVLGHEHDVAEKVTEPIGSTVRRRKRTEHWNTTADVLDEIEATVKPDRVKEALLQGLPERVRWRVGSSDTPGLSQVGVDVSELRYFTDRYVLGES